MDEVEYLSGFLHQFSNWAQFKSAKVAKSKIIIWQADGSYLLVVSYYMYILFLWLVMWIQTIEVKIKKGVRPKYLYWFRLTPSKLWLVNSISCILIGCKLYEWTSSMLETSIFGSYMIIIINKQVKLSNKEKGIL